LAPWTLCFLPSTVRLERDTVGLVLCTVRFARDTVRLVVWTVRFVGWAMRHDREIARPGVALLKL
jgi:hypothetical protein